MSAAPTVDVICSALNGEKFLPDLLESIERQTYTAWRLWLRDDGSSDRTVEIMTQLAERDSRVHVLHVGGPKSGVAGAYGWLLEHIPHDARYVISADGDDVWLPNRIQVMYDALRRAEDESSPATPILAHSDMIVVDETLEVIHQSYWTYTGLDPAPATLRRHLVRTIPAGPTLALNAALRELIGATPGIAHAQDAWFGLVAITLGRVVAVREPTVLYRQHPDSDSPGARDPRLSVARLPQAIAQGLRNGPLFRKWLAHSSAQARALLDRYRDRLNPADRRLLQAYADLPQKPFAARKLDLLRYRLLAEEGILKGLGVLLRG